MTPSSSLRLIELRLAAAAALEAGSGRSPWPPTYPDPFPALVGSPPEITGADLDTEVLGGAVRHHGCLVARNLLDQAQVANLLDAVSQARTHLDALDAGSPDHVSSWYRPVVTHPKVKNQVLRNMVAGQGGIWLADSPTGTARVLAELEATGVIASIAGHFGERPFFSLQKSTLRKSLPIHDLVAWHQDGSFLSRDVRTMNVWIALSPCGGDYPAPGLEVVPRRVEEVQPVDGGLTPHSISSDLVADLAVETPTVCPRFEPGDAMLFDERFVHRTHLPAVLTEIRFALECWFFAPSHQSTDYVPLLV
ncbi:MAG: phytanoyl-CoA dioxygenase family protein [Acidimicrobiales bacterium]